jgi:signal transduction histidine kinase
MDIRRKHWLKRLPELFEIRELDAARARKRIVMMERTVMLPVKVFFVLMIYLSFHYSPWMRENSSALDVMVETVQVILGFYICLSLLMALPLFAAGRAPLALLQWTSYAAAIADGLLLAAMTLITGGMDSILFWLFLGLIIRNTVSVPPGVSQLILNFVISICYLLVAVLDVAISSILDETTSRALDLSPHEEIGEPFVLRLLVLWLTAVSSYGVQAFLEKQRVAAEEAGEFAARESQLRSAGRLAAEFAHQIKNPLAVINNTAYSLRRSLRDHNSAIVGQQIEIIQEEVARADKVITQIMGYAQLSEGRVEKLDVVAEINRAADAVFPAAVQTGVSLQRDFAPHFPPLLMQRGHLSEILVNLLQNAREALNGHGHITIAATCLRDNSIEIGVVDDGPGIAADKLERIFEAYFTTKEKGSGLGLAIVRHDAELYGGIVRVESELGKGAKFIVTFPAKTMPKPFAK